VKARPVFLRYLAAALCLLGSLAQAELPSWQASEQLDHPHLGQVLDTATGQWLAAHELVERLAGAPRVLLGEKHDNPDHHALQHWLMIRLHERRAQGALVMEMLGPEQQAAVTALQGQPVPEDEQLASQINWSQGWDWALYGPLVRWGLTYPQSLLAANLGREEMLGFYRQPEPLTRAYDEQAREMLARIMRGSHCQKLPEAHVPAMLSIQQARDQRMAEVLRGAPAPALLVAGSFHVRKDLGVPLHWPADEPAPLVVMLVEAGSDLPGAAEADFLWITPATAPRDYCQDIP
jgi:uncharacterized iron-regulated protein